VRKSLTLSLVLLAAALFVPILGHHEFWLSSHQQLFEIGRGFLGLDFGIWSI
jgi:hypothetical protein